MAAQLDQTRTFSKNCAVCGEEGRVDVNIHHPVYLPNTIMHISKAFTLKGWQTYPNNLGLIVICPECIKNRSQSETEGGEDD